MCWCTKCQKKRYSDSIKCKTLFTYLLFIEEVGVGWGVNTTQQTYGMTNIVLAISNWHSVYHSLDKYSSQTFLSRGQCIQKYQTA